jgi:hypothetical protein
VASDPVSNVILLEHLAQARLPQDVERPHVTGSGPAER